MSNDIASIKANSTIEDLSGKYLTFMLGDEEYGVPILKAQEIISMINMTRIPKTPDYVKGVINLRGSIIPVIDMRLKLEFEPMEYNERTCIIVGHVYFPNGASATMGMIVDIVHEVVDIAQKDIDKTPVLGGDVDANCMLGIGHFNEKIVMLLDIDKVFCEDEMLQTIEVE